MKASLFFLAIMLNFSLLLAQANGPMPQDLKIEIDNFYNRTIQYENLPLEEDFVHERDVMWEKRIWREIPIKTKTNIHFRNIKNPLAKILLNMILTEEITAYSAINDEFKNPICADDLKPILNTKQLITVIDPETFEENLVTVENEFDYSKIIAFRIKEAWYFDSKHSKLNVRILGLAPIYAHYDDAGNFLFESVLCWLYYPDLRQKLVKEKVFNEFNEASTLSWTDVFDMRYFESNITKENNIFDRRIQDYKQGKDVLIEGQKIHESIRNFESDLWEY